jgi:hypothetical protein
VSTRVRQPRDLEIDGSNTVVPQSTDNQYLGADLFGSLVDRGRSLQDVMLSSLSTHPDRDAERFFEAHKTEYVRSLLYSRRLVINRAAFWNNPVLIAAVLGDDRTGLVNLLANETIVPYLWTERSFQQPQEFHTLPQGRTAMGLLVAEPALSDITCLRLGGLDETANQDAAEDLATNFRLQLQLPLERTDRRLRQILDALIEDANPSDQTRAALAARLREVAQWVRDEQPHRNRVYEKFITEGDPTTMPYRRDPFTFELKKWIDAIYNSNLPHALQARTFTAHGMPTPLDLGLSWAAGAQARGETLQGDVPGALDDIVDRARRHARQQAWSTLESNLAIPLPAPHELTHADVIKLRGWGSWAAMMSAMETHLEQPLDRSRMDGFWQAYDQFLREMANWWLAGGHPERQRYAAGVARIFRYGDWFVGLVQLGNLLFPMLPSPNITLPPFVEESAYVTVETGMYLYQRAGVEWRRSQAVRGIQRHQKVDVRDLVRTWEAVQRIYPELSDHALPGMAGFGEAAVEEPCG